MRRARVVDLLDDHQDFDAQLLLARRAAHRRDEAAFEAAFLSFRDGLLHHVDLEDATLVPTFVALADPRWPDDPRGIARDHAALRQWLAGVGAQPLGTEAAAARLDALSALAGLLDHHHTREARSFQPLLDAHLPAAAQDEVLDAFSAPPVARGPLPPCPAVDPWPAPTDPLADALWEARRRLAAGEAVDPRRWCTLWPHDPFRSKAVQTPFPTDPLEAWDRLRALFHMADAARRLADRATGAPRRRGPADPAG